MLPEWLILWGGMAFTLMVWSFLWKTNFWYRFAENVFVGIGAAHFGVVVYHGTLVPNLFTPLGKGNTILLIPAVLGLLFLTRLMPRKYHWMSRYPMALTMGVAAGTALRGTIQGTLFPQITAMFKPLTTLDSWIVLIGLVTTVFYFIFSLEAKGVSKSIGQVGRFIMMIYFGASFGSTVMTRLSALLGRLQFIFGDVLHVMK